MQVEWDNDRVIHFLELIENERAIWDFTDKNHKLKHKVHDAWKRVSQNMELPVEELKSKRKSLMATFRPLLKKKKKSIESGADPDDVFQPIWFAFETMERYLGPSFDIDETLVTEDDREQPPQQSHESPKHPPQQNLMQPPPHVEAPLKTEYNAPSKVHSSNKRLKTSDFRRLDEAERKIQDSFETFNRVLVRKREEEDECEMYTKLLAKKLRKYPERMRDRIMHKIDGLLIENPYPEEVYGSSSQSPYPYYQNSNLSPSDVVPNSPTGVKMEDENGTWHN